jgi:hypothetical protein
MTLNNSYYTISMVGRWENDKMEMIGSSHGLINVLPWHLSRNTGERKKKETKYSQC